MIILELLKILGLFLGGNNWNKRENGKFSLVPYVDEFVHEIDLENNKMIINPIEGLLWK